MKLYVTPTGSWAGTQADAKAIARDEQSSFEAVEVPTDKPGLLRFLNEQCVIIGEPIQQTPINEVLIDPLSELHQSSKPDGYAEFSVSLDEQFEKLPLAHQLHFAALAMERARDSIQ